MSCIAIKIPGGVMIKGGRGGETTDITLPAVRVGSPIVTLVGTTSHRTARIRGERDREEAGRTTTTDTWERGGDCSARTSTRCCLIPVK